MAKIIYNHKEGQRRARKREKIMEYLEEALSLLYQVNRCNPSGVPSRENVDTINMLSRQISELGPYLLLSLGSGQGYALTLIGVDRQYQITIKE